MKINYTPHHCNCWFNLFSAGKYVLLFLFLCAFFFGCKPNNTKNSDEERERELMSKNKVKNITEFTTAVHGEVEEKEYITKVTTFDQAGLKRKMIAYAADGSIESTIACDYDKNNNLVLMNGVNADGTSFREVTSYDKNGNRLELYHYLPDGTYKFKKSFTHDSNGKEIEIDWYGHGKLIAKVFYVYDGENLIKETESSPKAELVYTWNYKYDTNNNLVEAVQIMPDNTIMKKIAYTFGNDNQLIKKISYSGEEIENSKTFEYNENGLLLFQSDFNPFGNISIKYRYTYELFQ